MKKDGRYRFSLQFPSETETQKRVGELLERAGNRKSAIVVEAVNAYIGLHPELLSEKDRVTIYVRSEYGKEQIEQIVRRLIEERLAETPFIRGSEQGSPDQTGLEDDITQMLDNLDFFQ